MLRCCGGKTVKKKKFSYFISYSFSTNSDAQRLANIIKKETTKITTQKNIDAIERWIEKQEGGCDYSVSIINFIELK